MIHSPTLVALHGVSDLLGGIAFLVIAAAMATVLWRRRDLSREARLVGGLFALFLATSGLSHLSALVPAYGLHGVLKALSALTAGMTAIIAWPQIPKLLALPTPRDLAHANLALVQANASLETTIAWRTHELERATQRFEQALSRSNITVFTQDTDLRYTWVYNPRIGLSEEQLLGHTTEEIMPDELPDAALALKREALETGRTVGGTITVPTGKEAWIHLDLTISPTLDRHGEIDGILCTGVDVTEKRLFEIRLASMAAQLSTAYRRFELALDKSAIIVFEQDQDLRFNFIYNPPDGITEDDFLGRTDADILTGPELRKLESAKRRVLESGAREILEIDVELAGTSRFYQITLEPHRVEDRVVGIVGTAVDLTDRRRSEQRMQLMMREITHRSKNLLAVIQAMARKTATLSTDIDSFVIDFSARLRAMAAAHDLLVSQSWQGADLEALIRASVAQTIAPDGKQLHLSGPALTLAPDTAQNLGLAFHELATNASKYGALASDSGELYVTWERSGDEVRIRWQERGGPPVVPPEHTGFGRTLLERLVGATLSGSVSLDFRPDGLVCEIVFPSEGLATA